MRVVVIGATGTIGSAVADALAAKGHEVLRASRSGPVRVDLTDATSVDALFAGVGPVDAVVSCAGVGSMGAVTELPDAVWLDTLQNKVMGHVRLLRQGVANVRDNGAFVLTAGIWSQRPPPGAAAIAAANGALESLARAAARDLPRGVRVLTVSPPWIDESAQRMGMRGQLTAAENARFYVEAVESGVTGSVIYPS